jgi:tetratricopeptide (TPR) repeat protein
VPALWNILSQAGFICRVIGWPGIAKAEKIHGGMVTAGFFERPHSFLRGEWIIPKDSVQPVKKAEFFSQFRLHPEYVPSEWCETFIPAYFSEEPEVETPLTTIRLALAADRGKLDLALHCARKEEWHLLGVCFSGWGTIAKMGLPYRIAPRASVEELGIFEALVDSVYEWYDAWFGELLVALPANTNVLIVSDRGILNNDRRRGGLADEGTLSPYLTQGERGCLIASGPAFVKQRPIRRATLLDVCPTILSLYGIIQKRDMDGVVLENILASPMRPQKAMNWSKAFIGFTKRRDPKTLEIQSLCRLGMSFLDAGKLISAITSLHAAWERVPHSLEIASALASALLLAGHRIHASLVLQTALQKPQEEPETSLSWMHPLNLRLGWRPTECKAFNPPSRELLSAVAQWLAAPDEFSINRLFRLFRAMPDSFLLSLICGLAASWRGNWKDARLFLNRASALNASDPESLVEIARIHLRRGLPKSAIKIVRLALERAPLHLRGITTLAEALFALGNFKEAEQEAKRAARFIEQGRPALLILARISQARGDRKTATRYRRLACRVKQKLLAIGKSLQLSTLQFSEK